MHFILSFTQTKSVILNSKHVHLKLEVHCQGREPALATSCFLSCDVIQLISAELLEMLVTATISMNLE